MVNQALRFLYAKSSKTTLDTIDKYHQNFERADKIIIWIVGFSIGVFVILLTSEIDKTNNNYLLIQQISLQLSILSLIVVISGLLFRVFSFVTQMLMTEIIINYSSYADSFATAPDLPVPREISENDKPEDLLFYLKEDFGVILEQHDFNNMPDEIINGYRQVYFNYYKSLADTNNFENQLEEYKTTISTYFGISKKKIEKKFKDNKKVKFRGKLYQTLLIISIVFFTMTILIFISGIASILYKLLVYNCS